MNRHNSATIASRIIEVLDLSLRLAAELIDGQLASQNVAAKTKFPIWAHSELEDRTNLNRLWCRLDFTVVKKISDPCTNPCDVAELSHSLPTSFLLFLYPHLSLISLLAPFLSLGSLPVTDSFSLYATSLRPILISSVCTYPRCLLVLTFSCQHARHPLCLPVPDLFSLFAPFLP